MASDDPQQHDAQSISDELDKAMGAFFLGSEEDVQAQRAAIAPSTGPAQASTVAGATSHEVLDPEAAGTADFLGLDAELRAQWAEGAALDPKATNSWLLSVGREERAPLADAALVDGTAESELVQLGAEPNTNEFVETEIGSDGIGHSISPAPRASVAPRRSRRLVFAAASLALVLGALALSWYAKSMRAPVKSEPIVTLAPQVKPAPKPVAHTQTDPARALVAQVAPPTEPSVLTEESSTPTPEPDLLVASEPVAAEPAPTPSNPPLHASEPGLTFVPSGASIPKPVPSTLPSGARHPSNDDLKGIWGESSIPFAAVSTREWLHTPYVGAVRVRLKTGAAFEGRLDFVGYAQYWIDIGIGQLGFDEEYVAVVESIDVALKDVGKEPDFQTRIAGLPYVEVRVAGGWMAGWQLSREGRSVTLITPEPGKVTLDSDEVRPASTGRSIMRGPVQRN